MANDTIKFYYNPMSRGRVAHWMLEECGADYKIELLDWKKNAHKSPEYLKINPMGKIPAIVHRGVVITETAAICAYLADAFPQARLAPAVDDPQRGAYYRWLFFAASCIEPALTDTNSPRVNCPPPSFLGHGSYENVVKTLETAVADGFVLGNKFSAADLYLSGQIGWGLFTKTLPPKPAFVQYVRRCEDRPGYQRFIKQAGAL